MVMEIVAGADKDVPSAELAVTVTTPTVSVLAIVMMVEGEISGRGTVT